MKRHTNKFEEFQECRSLFVDSQISGEGSKPIFEREELKRPTNKLEEVEEHRIVSLHSGSSAVKPNKSVRRSASVSPLRKRSLDSRRTSHHSSFTNASQGRQEEATKQDDETTCALLDLTLMHVPVLIVAPQLFFRFNSINIKMYICSRISHLCFFIRSKLS